jgi:hypothetical protein
MKAPSPSPLQAVFINFPTEAFLIFCLVFNGAKGLRVSTGSLVETEGYLKEHNYTYNDYYAKAGGR